MHLAKDALQQGGNDFATRSLVADSVTTPEGLLSTWPGFGERWVRAKGKVSVEGQAKLMMARYYQANLGRFMAVDPGRDTDQLDSQSWDKYSYVRNNPIGNSDPTGTKIAPTEGADPIIIVQFLGAVQDAIAQDKSGGRVKAAFDQVNDSPNTHYIGPGDGERVDPMNDKKAGNGEGSDSRGTFNPDGYKDSDGHQMTPAEEAAHMLSHQEDVDTGTYDNTVPANGNASPTEAKATRMQNQVTKGEPKKVNDKRPVPNPTAVPPRPKATQPEQKKP